MEKLSDKPSEMRPPIPEPDGGNSSLPKNASGFSTESLSVRYRTRFTMLTRHVFKELFAAPGNVLTIFGYAIVLTVLLAPLDFRADGIPWSFAPPLFLLWVWSLCGLFLILPPLVLMVSLLQLKTDRIVALTPHGLIRQSKFKRAEIPWSRIIWIVSWSKDIQLCTFGGATFIPREAFISPKEAQEFVQIARELHKSRGAAWRDEWNGKTFGQNV